MNSNKVKSRGLSTVASVSVVSTVLSPVCANAFNLKDVYDKTKGVYYLDFGGGKRSEFNSFLSFVFAFLWRLFALDGKGDNTSVPSSVSENKVSKKDDTSADEEIKSEKLNKKNSATAVLNDKPKDNSSTERNKGISANEVSKNNVGKIEYVSTKNSADVYESVKKIMESLRQKYVLENFNSDRESFFCYLLAINYYETCRLNMCVKSKVAKVTIDKEKLTVDYTVGGLDKIVTVDFSEKDSLQKVTDVLDSIKLHEELLRNINDLKYQRAAIHAKEDRSMRICADNNREWRFYMRNKEYRVIKEMFISKYSFVTLHYEDGEEVSYDLTNAEHTKKLQNIFKNSHFVSLSKISDFIEISEDEISDIIKHNQFTLE